MAGVLAEVARIAILACVMQYACDLTILETMSKIFGFILFVGSEKNL